MNFITGAGGFLQSVIFGYGGIRLKMDGLHFDPVLPDATKGITLNGITYLGNKINFAFDSQNVTVEITRQMEQKNDLILLIQDKTYALKIGAPFTFVKCKGIIKAFEI